MTKTGRNDPCSCGSGKKYKQCCLLREKAPAESNKTTTNGPNPQEINTLVTLFNEGRYAEAANLAQSMTLHFPLHGFGWKVLGAIFKQMGQSEDALIPMQKAAALSPNDADAHSNLGVILTDLDRLAEAEASCRQAIKIKPNYAEAHNNLSITLQRQGRLNEAEASCRRALKIKPDYAEAHYSLSITLVEQGRLNEAEASCRRALKIDPHYAEAHNNLGIVLHEQDRLKEAEISCRRALTINPDYAEAHNNLGGILQDLRLLDEAETSCRRALELKPSYAAAHYNLGSILQELDRLDEAATCCRQALLLNPEYAEAHNSLGGALHKLGRLNEAETGYRRALEIKPNFAEAHNNLGGALKDLGRLNEAEACYLRALEIKPNLFNAYTNLLYLYGYHGLIGPHEYLALARNWEQSCLSTQDRLAARHRNFQRPPLFGRRLRVGYVSGDYCQHSMSYFVEQLFTHHDRARIELFAYSTQSRRDNVTERLQNLAEHWISLATLSDVMCWERIKADDIDVLIDLSGHTNHHRLGVFARRAAPVQAHYLGYFASTGLTEMDYWIGDEILAPVETDSHFSEQVWRLPRIWVSYDGKTDAPTSNWRPNQDGAIWLGSFNALGKLTAATVELWAKVLHALPEGKLLLKAHELSEIGNRQRILNALSSHGVLLDRIELQDRSATPTWFAHMAYYDRLDIALDPVGGVGGGTTSCDALWMGVPVITREGDRMASRMTASMLNAIGHPEWIACSEAEYIDMVVALARDQASRKALRFSQRDRMASSPLCDTRGLALSLENAYFEMFKRWQAR